MEKLTAERKGEIALTLLLYKLRQVGLPRLTGDALNREIGSVIEKPEFKKIKLTRAEALQFTAELIDEGVGMLMGELADATAKAAKK